MAEPLDQSVLTLEELQVLSVANEDHWLADDHVDIVLRCVRRLATQVADLRRLAGIP